MSTNQQLNYPVKDGIIEVLSGKEKQQQQNRAIQTSPLCLRSFFFVISEKLSVQRGPGNKCNNKKGLTSGSIAVMMYNTDKV